MERIDLSSIIRHTVQRTVGVGLLASVSMLAACGGGGGGGGGGNPDPSPTPNPSVSPSPTPDPGGLVGDAARRAVLADIGDDIILPALRDFDAQAASLVTAAEAYADAPADVALRQATQAAWDAAMTSWQRNEVLQVGPAGRSTNPDMVAGGRIFVTSSIHGR